MKPCGKFYWVVLIAALSACSLWEKEDESMLIFSKDFYFSQGEQEWTPGFADYPANADDSARFELRYAYSDPVGGSMLTQRSVMLSGKNVNRDLFMYLKRKITGLQPGMEYTITFNVELASDLNLTQANVAGSVYLKAGATPVEPESVNQSGFYVMNIDKGNHDTAGKDMISLGNILKPENSTGYTLISVNNTMANYRFVSKANSDGELWLIIGTDSDLEGTTSIYYTRINIVFSAS